MTKIYYFGDDPSLILKINKANNKSTEIKKLDFAICDDQNSLEEIYSLNPMNKIIFLYEEKSIVHNGPSIKKDHFIKNIDRFLNYFSNYSELNDTPILKKIFKYSLFESTKVLITGETGVGKTVLAKKIHKLIHKGIDEANFVSLNISAIPENLLESTLFGQSKGAFTGANEDKKGLLEKANNGTLFLDEIGSASLNIQKKLLKVIEEKSFIPLGSSKQIKVNFQLICATCEDLEQRIVNKEFREDLYYRINSFPIHLKPIREKKNQFKKSVKTIINSLPISVQFSEDAITALSAYHWPGNYRELSSFIKKLVFEYDSPITKENIQNEFAKQNKVEGIGAKPIFSNDLISTIKKSGLRKFKESLESHLIEYLSTIDKISNQQQMEILGVSKAKYYRMKKLVNNQSLNTISNFR